MNIIKEIEQLKQKQNECRKKVRDLEKQIKELESKLPKENKYQIRVGMWDSGSVLSKWYPLNTTKKRNRNRF